MRKFISELGVVPTIADPIDLYIDYNGAIAWLRKLDLTNGPCIYNGSITSCESSLTKVKFIYAECRR